MFFLSHARTTAAKRAAGNTGAHVARAQKFLQQFFGDLSEHVGELLASRAGEEPGFVDRSLQGSEHWSAEILHAVGTAQVFVALLSPAYVESDWCAMEWDAFSRRIVMRTDGHDGEAPTMILPVLWTPVPQAGQPKVVRAVHRFTPDNDDAAAAQYSANGIYGLLTTRKKVAYEKVVWQIGRRIADLCGQCQVGPGIPLVPSDLRNVFGGGDR